MDVAAVRHVAALAELTLEPGEEERFAAEIGRIVAYVAELDAVDTEGVPPTRGLGAPGDVAAWREDASEPGVAHDEALAGAPAAAHGGFSVPVFVG